METINLHRYILPVIIIFASFVLGYLFEKIIMYRLRIWSEKTEWKGDDVIIDSVRGMSRIIFLITGIYIAVRNENLDLMAMFYVHKTFNAFIILIFTIITARMAVGFVTYNTSKIDKIFPASSILRNIIRIVIYVMGALVILNNFNIPITPILTALGVGGIAVALALQPTLANLFSGVQIIAAKQLLPGDYISLETGQEGYVEDITWRYTTIRSTTNNMIVIPNLKIADTIITNYYKPSKEIPVLIGVKISKDSDLDFVEKIVIQAAKKVINSHKEGVSDFEPIVRYHTIGDSSIDLNVIVRVKEITQQFPVKHEVVKEILKQFKENKIEIPNPARTVYMRN
ncbi:MAG: mechanosensitive ion channel family protein [bacterium]